MLKVDLADTPLPIQNDGLNAGFPIHSAMGTSATAVVYFELDPGGTLPEHSDSAEELLLVLEGEVEASVDGESTPMSAGEIAVVPSMALHGLRNTGERKARIVGFFASSTNVATFTEPFGPDGPQLFVLGAPQMIAVPLEPAVAVRA